MKVDVRNASAIIKPDENIDLTNAEQLKEKFLQLVEEENIDRIILDFSEVRKIDSSGLGKLLLFNKIIAENEGILKIRNVNSDYVREVFAMVNLSEIIDIEM